MWGGLAKPNHPRLWATFGSECSILLVWANPHYLSWAYSGKPLTQATRARCRESGMNPGSLISELELTGGESKWPATPSFLIIE